MATEKFILQCSVCKAQNYYKSKNRATNTERLTLKKYCPKCAKHTPHNESRLRR